jgi:hypothetical protein
LAKFKAVPFSLIFDLLYKKLPKDLYFQEGLDEQDLLEARITLTELASSYSDI